jgi:hypothetical protein
VPVASPSTSAPGSLALDGGHAEVEQLDPAVVGDHGVGRLDVAVEDAEAMGRR